MKNILYGFILTLALLLTGCADAGKDQTVNANSLVTLDGSASTPSVEGTITKYRWKQVKGKKVKLSDKKAISPTFTAPNVKKKTKLVFRLTTKETGGIRSSFKTRDYVAIIVNPNTDNVDTIKPVITLNGEASVTLTLGDTYTDAGATASDNKDGDITANIVKDGSVDTSTEGDYTLTYNVTDTAGNAADEVKRNISVILPADTTPPIITLNGEDITLTIGDTYNEAGATAFDQRDGTVEVTISGTVDTTKSGTYTVTYSASDTAGNTVTTTRTVTVLDKVSDTHIYGKIVDIAGNALAGVKIYSKTHETFTDINGSYILATNDISTVSIVAELTNYIENSQVVNMEINSTQNFTLVSIDKIEIFDAEVGKEIKTKGAKISFPASSIVAEDGTLYTGEVVTRVAYNRVTSDIGKAAFPGEYLGETTEGNITILRSYGFIDVTIEDNESNTLKVAEGSSVTLTFPMDDNIKVTPDTIPLWYYDTTKGIWVEDGVATYNKKTNSYSGEVTHFTTWNLDAKMDGGSIEGCVKDIHGNVVTNAFLNIEGVGWGSGLRQNNGNTFKFINTPTGMPISLTAYTDEGASSTVTVTLNPNENHIMSDCLQIDANNTPYMTLKAKIVNTNGDLITNNIYGRIKNTITGVQIAYASGYNGYINLPFSRPTNNKISLELTLNGLSIIQTYVLDPNSNILDIGDVVFDEVFIKGKVVNQEGTPITTNIDISIRDIENTFYLSNIGAKPQADGTFTSNAFLRPTNNAAIVRVNTGIQIIDINTTLTGSTTDVGDIIIPGVSLSGQILDADGNPIQITSYSPGHIYDTSTEPPTDIGRFHLNSDGTFTTPYFSIPASGQIKLEFHINGTTITKTMTLDGTSSTVDMGNISTSLNKITGLLTDMSGNPISAGRMIILDADTNAELSDESVNAEGLISSNHITIPSSGNIKIRFYKTYFDDIYAEKDFHITNSSKDIGTVMLEVVSFKAKFLYKDGTPFPKNSIRAFIHDTSSTTYNHWFGSSINTDNGEISFNDFFRPSNNQILLAVPFSSDEFTKTIDLNKTNSSTYEEIEIDAVTITGAIKIPNNTDNSIQAYIYAPTIDNKDTYYGRYTSNVFTYGPILRPTTNTLELKVHSNQIFGEDITLPLVTLQTNSHNTALEEQNLTLSTIKSCINIPNGVTLDSLSVRTEPFSSRNIDYYNALAHSDKESGTFDATYWQNDNNQTLYVFATDTQTNNFSAITTFTPNQEVVDLTNSCQPLESEIVTEKNITVTQENYPVGNTISLQYMKRYPRYAEDREAIANDENMLTFTTSQNGVYRIAQFSNTGEYGGIFKITIDGVTTTLTIPTVYPSIDYSIEWNIFDIEIYQGNVQLIERNELEVYILN